MSMHLLELGKLTFISARTAGPVSKALLASYTGILYIEYNYLWLCSACMTAYYVVT